MSGYPGALDNFPVNRAALEPARLIGPDVDALADAVNKMQVALGVNPAGRFASAAAAIDGILSNSPANLKHYSDLAVGGDWTPAMEYIHSLGRPIYVPDGTFDVASDFDNDYDHAPQIIGAGKGRTVIRQQNGVSLWNNHQKADGTKAPRREYNRVPVAAALTAGDTVVHFDTTGYSVGDHVYIRSAKSWVPTGSAGVYAEMRRIRTIDVAGAGGQATLTGPIEFSYALADTPEIMRLDLLPHAHFQGFTFENPNPRSYHTNAASAIGTKYTLAPRLIDIDFVGMDEQAWDCMYSPYWLMFNCNGYDGQSDQGADAGSKWFSYLMYAQPGACEGLMFNCHGDNIRHVWTCGAEADGTAVINYGGPAMDNWVAFCSGKGMKSYGFNTHELGYKSHWFALGVENSNYSGYYLQAPHTYAEHCYARNVRGIGFNVDPGEGFEGGFHRIKSCRAESVRTQEDGSGGTGLSINAPGGTEVDDFEAENTYGVGVAITPLAVGAKLRRIKGKNTETSAPSTSRVLNVSANSVQLYDIYGEGVNRVVRYDAGLTGIIEHGVRAGAGVTNRRVYGGAITYTEVSDYGAHGKPPLTVLASGSQTIASGDSERLRYTANLTADRNLTLTTANAVIGQRKHFSFTGTDGAGAYHLNLVVGGVTIKAMASNTWAEVEFDGTTWVNAGSGLL